MHRTVQLTAVAIACLLSTPILAGQAAPTTVAAGSLSETRVTATALKGNLLGDPTDVRVAVYLPPSYASSPQRRYPTLYLLHGYTGDIEAFVSLDPVARTADRQIARAAAREMIIVIPSGRNGYLGSFYANSPVTGQWEDFISRELVAWADGHYRTLATPESRGIAGHSMGGYGAIMLAMKHPDVFGALYALSPCCVALQDDIGADNPAWIRATQYKTRDQFPQKPSSFTEFYAMAFTALAAAISPNPAKGPMFVDLPFEQRQERLVPNEPAYASWREKMPLYLVERYRTNLLKLRGIYLDYGALEEFSHIRNGTRALSNELTTRGIAHTFEVCANGTHTNRIGERIETRLLRFFSEVLAFPAA